MKKNLKDLFAVLGPYKNQYISAAIMLIVAMLFRALEPKIIQVVIDQVLPEFLLKAAEPSNDQIAQVLDSVVRSFTANQAASLLIGFGVLYLLIAILRGTIALGAHAIKAKATEQGVQQFRNRLFAHIQHLPLSYFDRTGKGELITRCTNDVDTIRNFMLNQTTEVVRLSAIFLFGAIMMVAIDWRLALVSCIVSPILGFSTYWFFKQEAKVWTDHEKEADQLNQIVSENLNGIRVVQAFAAENHEIEKFKHQNQRKLKIGMKQMRLHTYFWPLSDFLLFLQVAIAYTYGGFLCINGEITIGELVAAYTYVGLMTWPLRAMGEITSQMGMALVSMQRVTEILDEPTEQDAKSETIDDTLNSIQIQDLNFAYGDEQVLKNINLTIQPGEKVAFIGPSGSGKSTLAKLIAGLYQPTSGAILVNHKSVQDYPIHAYRSKVGMVFQSPFLFSTSIRKNIAYSMPEASDQHVLSAAQDAEFRAIETQLSKGLKTVVGEKGVSLSGGQKQRVALARTILENPDILILDDVTSAVDNNTEQAMLQNLSNTMEGKTTIIIAHRISSVLQADRIVVFNNGEVVQEGNNATLANQPGYYQEILKLQLDQLPTG